MQAILSLQPVPVIAALTNPAICCTFIISHILQALVFCENCSLFTMYNNIERVSSYSVYVHAQSFTSQSSYNTITDAQLRKQQNKKYGEIIDKFLESDAELHT